MQTTPKLRLAESAPARPDLAEQLAAPLAAATSSSQTPLGRPGPATMSALTTARLSAWRELSSRWMVLVLLPALLPIGLLLNDDTGHAWNTFLALMIAPVLCVLAAAGGKAESDAFWRGLGGAAWARQLGRQLVHLVLIGGAIMVLFFELSKEPDMWDTLGHSAVLVYLALYAATAAARTRVSGLALIAGPLAALVIIGTGMGSSIFWMRDWSLPLAWMVRLAGFTAAALVLSYRWERTAGLWSSAVSRGRILAPAACMSGLMLVSAGAEWAWSRGAMPVGHELVDITADGSVALYRSSFDEYSGLEDRSSVRYWLYTEADGYRRLPGRYHTAHLGKQGSVLGISNREAELQTAGFISRSDRNTLSTVTATLLSGDESLSCDLEQSKISLGSKRQWRSDGRGVIISRYNSDTQYIFDLDSGACGETSSQFYLGDELLEHSQTGVRWKNQQADFTDQPPSQGQWDNQGHAALIQGPQEHLYRIAIHDEQLVMTGPFSSLTDSIIVHTADHVDAWAGQDGMNYRELRVISTSSELLPDTSSRTVQVTTAENTAAQARSCALPDDWEPHWVNATRHIQVSQGEPDKSLNRPGSRGQNMEAYRNGWSSLQISTAPNTCSVLDSKLNIPTHRDPVVVGQSTVHWQGQEVPFGDGPPTSGQWSGQGHAVLIHGPDNHLYTITIDHQVLSVSGPFSDVEASGKVRHRDRGHWLSKRVLWSDAPTPMALDVLNGATWDLSDDHADEIGWEKFNAGRWVSWSPFFRDGEIVQFGGDPVPSTTP